MELIFLFYIKFQIHIQQIVLNALLIDIFSYKKLELHNVLLKIEKKKKKNKEIRIRGWFSKFIHFSFSKLKTTKRNENKNQMSFFLSSFLYFLSISPG